MARPFAPISTLPVKKTTAEQEALGRSRGGFSTKVHAACDALGNPVRYTLTPGERSEITQAAALLGADAPGAVIADKAYDSDAFIERIRSIEAEAVIPGRRNRRGQREIDTNLYADRNKIERLFSRLKHYRRIATRYEKTARNYMAFLHVASIITLLL